MQDSLNFDPLKIKKKYQRNCLILLAITALLGLLIFNALSSAKAQLQSYTMSGNLLAQQCFSIVLLICGVWLLNKSYFAVRYEMVGSFFIFPKYGRNKMNKYFGVFFLILAIIIIIAGFKFLV